MATPPAPNLTPLLDKAALLGFATEVLRLRQRMADRYGEAQPTAVQLALAMYAHLEQSDQARLEQARARVLRSGSDGACRERTNGRTSCDSGSGDSDDSEQNKPSRADLERYLRVADAAYATTEDGLASKVSRLSRDLPNFDGGKGVLKARVQSDKYAPAFFVMFEHFTETLIVSIRGSYETADMVTDLSTERVPFLIGGLTAHKGVAQSAVNVHAVLRRFLARELTKRNPAGGLVVTGHSLGAGTGAALTMLLRRQTISHTGAVEESHVARRHLRNVKCYAFGPPPFVSPHPGLTAVTGGITTIVNGWDFVPRVSVASINRLADTCARLDLSPTFQDMTHSATRSVAGLFVDTDQANALARSVSRVVSNTDAIAASRAVRAISGVSSGSSSSSSLQWPILSGLARLAVTTMTDQVEQHTRRVRRARELGWRGDGAAGSDGGGGGGGERHVFVHDQQRGGRGGGRASEGEMVLVGDIWHLDRQFTNPVSPASPPPQRVDGVNGVGGAGLYRLPRSWLVRRRASFFRDIEMSTWMKYDHYSQNMVSAVRSLPRV